MRPNTLSVRMNCYVRHVVALSIVDMYMYILCILSTLDLVFSNVKAIQKINEAELKLGVGSKSSWHDEYRDSAYTFIGT